MSAPVDRDDDPAYRPCVGIMLLDASGRVFVGRRTDTESEAWQMPQGGIDADETARAAAHREMREEIGTDNAAFIAESRRWYRYDLPPPLQRKLWGGRYVGQTQKWFAFRFRGTDAEIDLGTHHREFVAWRWVPVDDLACLIVPFKRAVYAAVVEEFRDLAGPVDPPA
ncbi:MAG: RNA pyrophosphohydrolase [Alphaproteobacteria bacterium]|nr:RNA pyrophosphohydrolase [Alphaproteobacteria bacterium]